LVHDFFSGDSRTRKIETLEKRGGWGPASEGRGSQESEGRRTLSRLFRGKGKDSSALSRARKYASDARSVL